MRKYTLLLSHSNRDYKKLFDENENFGFTEIKAITDPFSLKELPKDFDSCSVLIQDNEKLWWESEVFDKSPDCLYKDAHKKLNMGNYCTLFRVSK